MTPVDDNSRLLRTRCYSPIAETRPYAQKKYMDVLSTKSMLKAQKNQTKVIPEIPELYVFLCPFMTVLFYVAYGLVTLISLIAVPHGINIPPVRISRK